ncbi:hypothetical protein LCGC14_1357870 [marine sediment metagenome]|uniref:Uncharacterized protein n=1 Tax=marine sediment metagenome TaxID=412755 RepID=A0A0F9NB87_9ZZZZ
MADRFRDTPADRFRDTEEDWWHPREAAEAAAATPIVEPEGMVTGGGGVNVPVGAHLPLMRLKEKRQREDEEILTLMAAFMRVI